MLLRQEVLLLQARDALIELKQKYPSNWEGFKFILKEEQGIDWDATLKSIELAIELGGIRD